MATPKWEPGHAYPTGSIVQPKTAIPSQSTEITNANFDDGSNHWMLGANTSVISGFGYGGSHALRFDGSGGVTETKHDMVPVIPGKSITASCMYAQGTASSGQNTAAVQLYWFDLNGNPVAAKPRSAGTLITSSSGGGWKQSTVTDAAPAGAAFVAIGIYTNRTDNGPSFAGQFAWNYPTFAVPAGLVYKAVQPKLGTSAPTEPVWPLVNGNQVVDNTVTWEAVTASRVVWTASPILKSGPTEPDWPVDVGQFVADHTISWETVSRRVTDPKCPNSKIVLIASSKVFAGDDDIVPYCATVNPLDWSSEKDAGYLPTGLQQYGANPTVAMGLYRSNVVVWNTQGSQTWQVDEDPELMNLLDAFPIGANYHRAVAPVANDLFFLTPLGVRSMGIVGGTRNLQAGDAGMPIDPLVQNRLLSHTNPRALYYPAQGQYWLFFGNEAFVYTLNELGKIGKWSRYLYPWAIDGYTIKGDDLYLRHGNTISRVVPGIAYDEVEGEQIPFDWVLQWNWLDFGAMGVTKQLIGFDIVATGVASIEIGYNQANGGLWTTPWEIVADSIPGEILALPVAAPSMAIRLTFAGGQPASSWEALNLYFQDFRVTS